MGKSVKAVYGDALFELAREKEQTTELSEEFSALNRLLNENHAFYDLIENPQINQEEKQKLLEEVFSGQLSDTLSGFLQLLVQKNHFGQLPLIYERYMERYRQFHGIGVAKVTSSVELTDSQKEKIHSRLLATAGYQTIEAEYSVDPSLIGGVVIRIGDRVVDGSVKNRLDRLKGELLDIQLG